MLLCNHILKKENTIGPPGASLLPAKVITNSDFYIHHLALPVFSHKHSLCALSLTTVTERVIHIIAHAGIQSYQRL